MHARRNRSSHRLAIAILGVVVTTAFVGVSPAAEGDDATEAELVRHEYPVRALYSRGGVLTIDAPPDWAFRIGSERSEAGAYVDGYAKMRMIGPDGAMFEMLPMFGYGGLLRDLVDHAVSDLKRKHYRRIAEDDWLDRDDRGKNKGIVHVLEIKADGSTVLSGAFLTREVTVAVRGDDIEPDQIPAIVAILRSIRMVAAD